MIVSTIAVLAYAATAVRLITYRRGCARYRPMMSALAYALIVCSGAQAIDIVFNGARVSLWGAGVAVVFAALVWRARGNVACVIRRAVHD